MPRRLPPLNALRAFEAAGRHSSFSKAAVELNVSHSAISRHVRGLEKRLCVQLFKVIARGVELTEPGKKYLSEISPTLDQIADATDRLLIAPEGSVSLSCESTFAIKWLMPRLGQFETLHPNVKVGIDATPKLADIEQFECDLAIRFRHHGKPEQASDLISNTQFYPIGAPELNGGAKKLPDLTELQNFKLIQDSKARLWQLWFAEAGMPNAELPNISTPLAAMLAIESALAGQGLFLASEEVVASDVKAGKLMRFSDIGIDYGRIYLVYRPETIKRNAVNAFRNWLLDTTKELRN